MQKILVPRISVFGGASPSEKDNTQALLVVLNKVGDDLRRGLGPLFIP